MLLDNPETAAIIKEPLARMSGTSSSLLNDAEYEDSEYELHTMPADIVAVCAGQRKVGLDLYEQLLEEGYEAYRIGIHERASNFLNATRSAFELAYTI